MKRWQGAVLVGIAAPVAVMLCVNVTARDQPTVDWLPLDATLRLTLAAEGRPVRGEGWRPARAHRDTCLVRYALTLGNEAHDLAWWYTPATGKVETLDALTKRLSGW
jgi:uncharacterized cysteine cluster protein YcgN (CxxCxxCC family)